MNWLAAALLIWAVCATVAGLGLGRLIRRNEESREEAWENGCQHGLRLAHHTVAHYQKPWITYGEERGWDLAREQLRQALADLVEDE